MLRPLVSRANRPRGLLLAADVAAVALLALLAAYVLWDAGIVRSTSWQIPALALGAALAAYWILEVLNRGHVGFWLLAPVVALPHVVLAWPHNRIGWNELLELPAGPATDRSLYWDGALFLACLAVLIGLHRINGIKRLNRQLSRQGLAATDRWLLVRFESFLIIGLVLAGLLVMVPLVAIAAALTPLQSALGGSPAVIAPIGSVAGVLLSLTLWLWFRGPQVGGDPEDQGIRNKAENTLEAVRGDEWPNANQ